MAKETSNDIYFQTAVDIARQIEMVHAQERRQVSDKRPRHFGGFSGASPRGRCTFGRDHPPSPLQSTLQASHSASGSHGPYVPHSGQPSNSAPSAYINAPPIQRYHRGYIARPGQF